MSRLVIKHNGKIPLISESYNKIGEWPKPYGIGMLVALHNEGGGIKLFLSTDGLTFTYSSIGINVSTGAGGQYAVDGAFSTAINRYVVSTGGPFALGYVIYTDNFVNWFTASTAFTYQQDSFAISYSPSLDKFVIVGENRPQSSTTGVTWSLSPYYDINTGDPMQTTWENVEWIDNLSKFVATSYSGSKFRVAHSTDGENWSQFTGGTQSPAGPYIGSRVASIYSFAYSPTLNRFVGIDPSFATFSYSNDGGYTWSYITQSSASFSDVSWRGVAYSDDLDLFVAIGLGKTSPYQTNKFAVSKTGLTWSLVYGPTDTWGGRQVIRWSKEFQRFIMFAGNANWTGSSQYAWSADGYNWFTSSCYGDFPASGNTFGLLSIPNLLI